MKRVDAYKMILANRAAAQAVIDAAGAWVDEQRASLQRFLLTEDGMDLCPAGAALLRAVMAHRAEKVEANDG